ncbi:MAG TPA: type 1 glutamine amidotransferase [Bradyrhizobium sp.]|nr:type 1 glutamine amidotransferase [Bradyrhizobium sp.]
MLRLLVADGNDEAGRRRIKETAGATAAESYRDVLRNIAPDAVIDICTPADKGMRIPQAIESYHGVAITGSSLNIYERDSASLRQIDFIREVFACGVPIFGSCWGLQLAAVAAGGEVLLNPVGREVAFARKVTLTDAGRRHPMHRCRALCYDAPAIHSDIVTRLPQGAVVTAYNAVCEVQAAEIRLGRGLFWGVQYHPEYSLHDVCAVIGRYGQKLVDEGFFLDLVELRRYENDLATLDGDRSRRDIAWRLDLGQDILSDRIRWTELSNWLDGPVRNEARSR